MTAKWYRVTRKRPCRICKRPDWCGFTEEGAACCMRIESGKVLRNGGWLHVGDDLSHYVPPAPIRQAIPDPVLDAQALWQRWFDRTDFHHLDGLGMSLGVDTDALRSIGCAWASQHGAWAFPMKSANGNVIGIRLRNDDGNKWAVKGSHQGLFIPSSYPFCVDDATLHIVEGPTDLASALTLGLYAIGRAACLGQESMVVEFMRTRKIRRVVIVSDNDTPGLRGAEKLQSQLPILSCIWCPPTKDVREFLNAGGNALLIESCIKDLVWTKPQRRAA